MHINNLLKKGYFPNELPPPFTTDTFALEYDKVKVEWAAIDNSTKKKFEETVYIQYNCPKLSFSRRIIGIPNPIHFSELSETICANWIYIQKIYKQSDISASKPIINNLAGRSVNTRMNFGLFKKQCIIDSFDKIYELKTDISKYYHSIYTHSIPWAIHTKTIAKVNRNNFSLYGNKLDKDIRKGQNG